MAPAFAEEGPSKEWRRRFTKTETNEYMKTHDLDPSDKSKRKLAGRRMKNERQAQWRDQAKDQPLRQRTASEANLPGVKGADAPRHFPAPISPVATLLTDDDDLLIDPQLRKDDLPVHATMKSLMDAIILQGEAGSSKDDDNVPDDSDAVRTDTADEVDLRCKMQSPRRTLRLPVLYQHFCPRRRACSLLTSRS
jgi:hypothetical protein